MSSNTVAAPYPPFWTRLSVAAGNAIQVAGLLLGAALLYLDGRLRAASIIRVVLMIAGWLAIYICCHALAHYVVGRLAGIRFRGYGVRGTDHPEVYPPGARQVMSILPFFTVMTDKSSMAQASPIAKALMFAAGEFSTILCSILAGWFAGREGLPGGGILYIVSIIVAVIAGSTAFFPKGDFFKARNAWRDRQSAGHPLNYPPKADKSELPRKLKYPPRANIASLMFLQNFGPEFTHTPGGHIETDIAGASCIAGLMLVRSLAPVLTPVSSDVAVLSDIQDAQNELLTYMQNTAALIGLDPQSGWDTPISSDHQPMFDTLELIKRLEQPFYDACRLAKISKQYWAHAAALAAIKLIAAGNQLQILDQDVGKGLAAHYLAAGAKMNPDPQPQSE